MKRFLVIFSVFFVAFSTFSTKSMAWGYKGHAMVADIAYHFLPDSTRLKVKKYLGNLSFSEAANWMDEEKSNSYYDYMRTWHYINMEKGEKYTPSSERNAVTVLFSAINGLKEVNKMKRKDIRYELLLIFHLVGDMHQPLHNGYGSDRGGNNINVSSTNFGGNLHSCWDTQILESEGVNFDRCLGRMSEYTPARIDSIKKINVLRWMYQSRAYLDFAYGYDKNNFLDKKYVDSSVVIIENQILQGGLRLAAILEQVFKDHQLKDVASADVYHTLTPFAFVTTNSGLPFLHQDCKG